MAFIVVTKFVANVLLDTCNCRPTPDDRVILMSPYNAKGICLLLENRLSGPPFLFTYCQVYPMMSASLGGAGSTKRVGV